MATSATAQINLSANVTYSNTIGGTTYTGQPTITGNVSLSSTDITKVFSASYSGAGAVVLNVNSGLTDAFGTALVFSTVKAIVVRNTHATASVVIGGGSDPLMDADQITLKAGKAVAITSAFTVVGGLTPANKITLTPSASATFDVMILGS